MNNTPVILLKVNVLVIDDTIELEFDTDALSFWADFKKSGNANRLIRHAVGIIEKLTVEIIMIYAIAGKM